MPGGIEKPSQRAPLLLIAEAVAQTPTELTEAVLRVGSKIARLVARAQRDRADVTALSGRYGHHRALSPVFRGRLYATASAQSGRPAVSPVSQCKSPERIVAHVHDPAPQPT